MSLIDLLFQQQLILISLGLGLLPLVLAALMVLVKAIRGLIATISQRRAAAKQRRQQRIEQQAEENRAAAMLDGLVDEDELLDADDDLPAGEAVIHQVKVGDAPEAGAEAEGDEEGEEGEEHSSEDAPTGAMQDILNAVFVDEEADARVEVLLQDAQDIAAADLAVFAQNIADELDARAAS